MRQKRDYPGVQITAKAERAVKRGHPWVYGTEIRSVQGTPQNGGLVDVFAGNAYMGTGFYNDRSRITVRLLSRRRENPVTPAFLTQRVRSAWEYRKKVIDTSSCRLLFGDIRCFVMRKV